MTPSTRTILVDLERLKYPFTGLYSFDLNLGRQLERLQDAHNRLTYFLPKKSRGLFDERVDYLYQHPAYKYGFPLDKKYDVWHSTYQGSAYFPRKKSTKIIQTIHDLNFLYEKQHSIQKIKAQLKRIQQGIDRAEVITCISKFTMNEVEGHLRLGDQRKVVIYNGCGVPKSPVLLAPQSPPTKKFIFTVGTVLPKKNFHTLPSLLAGNDYELVIAGLNGHPYEAEIWAEAKKFNVASRVQLTGPIREEEKFWYYQNCLAFAFPSLAEGFGLPVVEAMHFGKPIFLSDKTSLPEIGGLLAYYFNSFDPEAMQIVFKKGLEESTRTPQTENLQHRASLFSWEAAARAYFEEYK